LQLDCSKVLCRWASFSWSMELGMGLSKLRCNWYWCFITILEYLWSWLGRFTYFGQLYTV